MIGSVEELRWTGPSEAFEGLCADVLDARALADRALRLAEQRSTGQPPARIQPPNTGGCRRSRASRRRPWYLWRLTSTAPTEVGRRRLDVDQ